MDLALEDLTRRALRLRLVVADCDGVLTDAIAEAKRAAHHVTASPGGHGALRDFAAWILRLRRGD